MTPVSEGAPSLRCSVEANLMPPGETESGSAGTRPDMGSQQKTGNCLSPASPFPSRTCSTAAGDHAGVESRRSVQETTQRGKH